MARCFLAFTAFLALALSCTHVLAGNTLGSSCATWTDFCYDDLQTGVYCGSDLMLVMAKLKSSGLLAERIPHRF